MHDHHYFTPYIRAADRKRRAAVTATHLRSLAAALLFCVFAIAAASAAELPQLTGRVVDNAQVLSAPARSRIDAALAMRENRTTDQIVVLTVPNIGEDTVEQYAQKVFESWKLGVKGQDNAVLLVIVPRDRVLRIHVGYGLEGALPDASASRIIRDVIVRRLKTNDFDAAVEQGLNAIIAQLDRGATPTAVPIPKKSGAGFFYNAFWLIALIALAFVSYRKATSPKGWFAYVVLAPLWWLVPAALIGPALAVAVAGVFVAAYPTTKLLVRRTKWYHKINAERAAEAAKFMSSGRRSSWRSSSSGSASGSSSSSYSGGGGDSGGGGASGRW